MKSFHIGCILVIVLLSGSLFRCGRPDSIRLKVSEDKRFLVYEDGTPFFYLGDTAWELFHRLNREDAEFYFKNRVGKGFTVVQAVILAEFEGLKVPNAYGHLPLEKMDPMKPNDRYFDHVDYIVDIAQKLGLFIGMLPTWGDKWNKRWGIGPEIFTPDNARIYGKYLGERYKDKPVIWILGGDRSPESEQHLAIIRAMAQGLSEGDGGNHLMTFHPWGGAHSSKWFHKDGWLDFNMFQSGHSGRDIPNDKMMSDDYALEPAKPVLDGEPRYEDHPVNWDTRNGWFDDFDVRQAAYWAILSGACGHTYGNHNIWQMWEPGRQPVTSARTSWKEALEHPGSKQMAIMKKLMESGPWQKLIPDQSMLRGEASEGEAHIQCARAGDYSFLFAYSPAGKPFLINTSRFFCQIPVANWFNPRNGYTIPAGSVEKKDSCLFTPPSQGRGQDWVLVMDDPDKGYIFPGIE